MAISINSDYQNNQTDSLVSLAVQNDRSLLDKIYTQRDVINKKISTLSSLRSSVNTFRSTIREFTSYANPINKTKATSSDTTVLSAYSDYGASNGSLSVEVLSLASSYKLGSDGFSKDSSTIIADTGSGTKRFSISCGSNSYDLSVNLSETDKDYDVLVKIKDAINNTSGINVRSSIIQESDNNYTLLMESKNSGTSNIISFNDIDGLLYHSKIVNSDNSVHRLLNQAKDAVIKIGDNLTITRSSNEIKDAIVGVTLNLYKTGNSLITVSQDKDYLISQLKEFVNNYNNVVTSIGRNIYQQKDGTDPLKGIFYSDSRLRSIRNSLRQLFYTSVDGKSIFDFGFNSVSAKDASKEESYNITLDESSLSKIIDEDPDSIINFFNSDSGLFKKIEDYLDSLLSSSGYMDMMNNSLNNSLSLTTRKISSMEKNLNQKITYYTSLYSTYSNQVDSLKSQNTSLQSLYSSLGI